MKKNISRRNIVEVSREYTLKIANRYEGVRPKRLAIECFALRQAGIHGISVPNVFSHGTLVDGREYMKIETVNGEQVSSKNLSISLYKAYENAGKLFRNTGSEFDRFGWVDSATMQGVYTSWEEYLTDFVSKYGMRLYKKGILQKTDVSLVLKHIKKSSNPIKKAGLVHRDLDPQHLIYNRKNGKVYVIDWENVILGDPFFDLAVLRSRFGGTMIYKGYLKGFLGRELNKKERSFMRLYSVIIGIGELDFNQVNNLSLSATDRLKRQLANLASGDKR